MLKILQLRVYQIFSISLGICACVGITISTQSNKPYDERTYILVLTIGAGLLWIYLWEKSIKLSKELKREK